MLEALIRFLDKVDEAVVAAAFSIRRRLAPKPKERRKDFRRREDYSDKPAPESDRESSDEEPGSP